METQSTLRLIPLPPAARPYDVTAPPFDPVPTPAPLGSSWSPPPAAPIAGSRHRSRSTAAILPLRLADGRAAALRPLTAADRGALEVFYAGLSAQAQRLRFMTPTPRLDRRLLDELAAVDGDTQVAWGVEREGRLLAVGRYRRLPADPATADLAVTVADDERRGGLASRLLEALTRSAADAGVERFSLSVHGDNRPAQALFQRFGATWRWSCGLGEAEVLVRAWLWRFSSGRLPADALARLAFSAWGRPGVAKAA